MSVKRITSAQNAFYKQVKKLISRRDTRLEQGEFAVEGKRLFADALASGLCPKAILLDGETLLDDYAPLCRDIYLLTPQLMQSLCDTKTPQGVLGVFPIPARAYPLPGGQRQLLLCSLQDPGNVGTILRTAEAFGISRVTLSADCPDLYSPKVLRASMGGMFRMEVTVVEDVHSHIHCLREAGFRVYAAALSEGARSLEQVALAGNVCVVIGNEGNGLPEDAIAECDGALRIPMRGRAQSLNAAMAAGIFIWEMTKEA